MRSFEELVEVYDYCLAIAKENSKEFKSDFPLIQIAVPIPLHLQRHLEEQSHSQQQSILCFEFIKDTKGNWIHLAKNK